MITPSLFPGAIQNTSSIYFCSWLLVPNNDGSSGWHGCQTYCPVSSCPRTGGRGNKEQEEAEILCAQAHNLIPLGLGAGFQATACGGSWQKLGAQYCIKEKEKKIENCCADSDPYSPPSSGGAVKQRRGVPGPCSIHAKQLKHKGASPGSF